MINIVLCVQYCSILFRMCPRKVWLRCSWVAFSVIFRFELPFGHWAAQVSTWGRAFVCFFYLFIMYLFLFFCIVFLYVVLIICSWHLFCFASFSFSQERCAEADVLLFSHDLWLGATWLKCVMRKCRKYISCGPKLEQDRHEVYAQKRYKRYIQRHVVRFALPTNCGRPVALSQKRQVDKSVNGSVNCFYMCFCFFLMLCYGCQQDPTQTPEEVLFVQ